MNTSPGINVAASIPLATSCPPAPSTAPPPSAEQTWSSLAETFEDGASTLHGEARAALAEGVRQRVADFVTPCAANAATLLGGVVDKAGYHQRLRALGWLRAHAVSSEEGMAADLGTVALEATRSVRGEAAVAGEAVRSLAQGIHGRADVAEAAVHLIGAPETSAGERFAIAQALTSRLALTCADAPSRLAFEALQAVFGADCKASRDARLAVAQQGIRGWGDARPFDPYAAVCDASAAASTDDARLETLAAASRVLAASRGSAYTDEAEAIIARATASRADAYAALADFTRQLDTLEPKPLREARALHDRLVAAEPGAGPNAPPTVTVTDDAVTIAGVRIPRSHTPSHP